MRTLVMLGIAACSQNTRSQASWQLVTESLPGPILGIWGASEDDVWLVGGEHGSGRALALHFDGAAFTTFAPPGATLQGVWGNDERVFMVGDRGTIVSWRDGRFEELEQGRSYVLFSVWANSREAWTVGGSFEPGGERAVVRYFDGTRWTARVPGLTPEQNYFAVRGSEGGDVFIVGERGAIVRFRKGRFERFESGTKEPLRGLVATDDGQLLAVGGETSGVVLRFDGTAWQELTSVSAVLFAAGWGTAGVFVAGATGFLGIVDSDALSAIKPLTSSNLYSAWGFAGTSWAAGEALLTTRAGLSGDLLSAVPDASMEVPDGGASSDGSQKLGEGEDCSGAAAERCESGLECWYVVAAEQFICTSPCGSPSECSTVWGEAPCCLRPGTQTSTTVCMWSGFGDCP